MDAAPANSPLQPRGELMAKVWGAAFCFLVSATGPLWLPGTEFPAVPLFSLGAAIPEWLEWVALTLALCGAGAFLTYSATSPYRFVPLLVWGAGVSLLVVADQQRAQAWVWHGALIGGVLTGARPSEIVPALRWLTAGLYFHSAVSKLDATFVATLGRDFLLVPLQALGLAADDLPGWLLVSGALAFPLVELALAGLAILPDAWRLARWLALAGAAAMHLALMAILGWGLGHQPGVVLWNLFFVVQAFVLFWPADAAQPDADAENDSEAAEGAKTSVRLTAIPLYAALFLGVGLPCFAPWGLCDPWPAWELYAPRVARLELHVARSAVDRLPDELRAQLPASIADDVLWLRVPLDRWTLAQRRSPLYPHPRVQLGLAIALAEQTGSADSFRAILFSAADRWSGGRTIQELRGIEALRMAASRYWVNALPAMEK